MKKFLVAVVLVLTLAACGGHARNGAARAVTTIAVPTTTMTDPGVAACRASKDNQKVKAMPTMAQREASWNRYQQSHYPALRDVGVKLEKAWTEGSLSDQIAAGVYLMVECAAHGIVIDVKQ